MQCYYRAVLLSTIAACCLLVPTLSAQDNGPNGSAAWTSHSNQSRDPTRYQTHQVQGEGNHQRNRALPEHATVQPAVTSANYYQAPPQQGGTVQTASHVEPTLHTELASQAEPARKRLPSPTSTDKKAKAAASSSSGWKSLVSAVSGLLFVIAIFVGFAYLTRRAWQPASGTLPKQVFEVLGRSSYAPRQQVVLMKFGNKVLLVNHELGNVQTLSEIEAEEEVERIVAACEQNSPSSLSANFGNVLSQVIHGKTERTQNKRSMFSNVTAAAQARRAV